MYKRRVLQHSWSHGRKGNDVSAPGKHMGTLWKLDDGLILRESVPRQVDRESRGPQGERGLEFSRRKKGQSLDSTFCYLKMLIMGVDLVFTRVYLA